MGYSPASQAGIRQHGVMWKHTISGVNELLETVEAELIAGDAAAVDAALRRIANRFTPFFNEDNNTSSEADALEWFQHEGSNYWIEGGELDEFHEEFNHRLNELYDFADFNRIWVKPHD